MEVVSYQVQLGTGVRKFFVSKSSGNFKNNIKAAIHGLDAPRFTLEVAEELAKRLKETHPNVQIIEAVLYVHKLDRDSSRTDKVIEDISEVWQDTENPPEQPDLVPPSRKLDLRRWGYK
jgi:hypothetical protein